MIRFLIRYGFVIYLFNTILLSITDLSSIGNTIFLSIMCLFLLFLLINPKQVRLVIFYRPFLFFTLLNMLNLVYWLFFHEMLDIEALKYLFARAIQFSIISFSIYYNYDYFKGLFFKHLVFVIFIVLFLGLFISPYDFLSRYSGVFWNPNVLASFCCIGFGVLLLSNNIIRFRLFLLVILFLISLSTGSRGVLLGIGLAFFFKFGFSYRNFLYSILAVALYFLIINLQVDSSIHRFASQDLFNDRILQYKYAYETFLQKPLSGFGLDKYAFVDPNIIPLYLNTHIISAHNSYLAILVQYGLIFGIFFLAITFYTSFKSFVRSDSEDPAVRIYRYILIYALLASLYETLITGINEFHTILFWFSLAFLSYSSYKIRYED